uniref:ribosomal protein S7 n=1 Tax=Dictyotopsis propagulifera TaxID=670095 RepID=UPI002E76FDE7|nr:ribosomal protein S7 [Dictyotopsis propagulifera]WBP69946.1 ribosomal protein S7 [Dictyotopsis propagulifera]
MELKNQNYNSSLNQFKLDPLIKKVVNLLMKDGKKSKSEKILYKIFFSIQNNFPGEVLNIFYLAVFNTQLLINVRSKLKGKKHRRFKNKEFFVPYFVSTEQSQTLAIRAIFLETKKIAASFDLSIWDKLAQELVNTALFNSDLLNKRYKFHILSNLNKRYYRFRWKRKLLFKQKFSV